MTTGSRLFLNRLALEGFLELPTKIQRQVVRKLRDVEAAPESMGYPLHRPLQGFRGVHSGRYRTIWRMITLEDGERVAEVCYVGIRAQEDERDAYSEAERIFGNMGWLLK
jgi:mRNA-degrading endonuclease RelE of RelBE toxin-antitoxin system